MKHLLFLLLSATCILCLAGCSGGPSVKQGPIPEEQIAQPEVQQPAPTIKVFVENSGSMYGYVKGATDFENAVYSYLSDLQLADLGLKTSSKNILQLNYINSQVLKQQPDLRAFIAALEPQDFKMKGGNLGTSDMSNIIDMIISQNGDNDVSILVSDCIFSPGKKYQAKDNADEYIVAQQIGIKSHIVEKLAKNPDFSIVVMRLTSQFNGTYYNKFDERQQINNERPFYMWLMGDRAYLKAILDEVALTQIKGKGVQNLFMISKPLAELPYTISVPQPGSGKYKVDMKSKNTITRAKTDRFGSERRFKVALNVDFSNLLLPEEYILDPQNYKVSNSAYEVEVVKNPGANSKTHTVYLKLKQQIISRGIVTISLLNKLPSWSETYTDESGLDIMEPGAMEKTYGLKYLLGGVYDAYATDKQYGSITINIQ